MKRFQSVIRAFSKRFQSACEDILKSKKILKGGSFGTIKGQYKLFRKGVRGSVVFGQAVQFNCLLLNPFRVHLVSDF